MDYKQVLTFNTNLYDCGLLKINSRAKGGFLCSLGSPLDLPCSGCGSEYIEQLLSCSINTSIPMKDQLLLDSRAILIAWAIIIIMVKLDRIPYSFVGAHFAFITVIGEQLE